MESASKSQEQSPDAAPNSLRFNAIIALVIAVTLLGAALRLYHLSAESLWYDEAVTIHLSDRAGLNGKLFDTTQNMEAPLMAMAVRMWRAVLPIIGALPPTDPARDFLYRLLPALASILCIPLVYIVSAKLLQNRPAALVAALLCALSPYQLYYGQELRSYAFSALFGLVGLYFFMKVLEHNRHRDYVPLTLALALLVSNHFVNVWTVVAFNGVALLAIISGRPILLRWTAYQAGMLVVLSPVLKLAFEANRIFQKIPYQWETYPRPTPKIALITFKTFFAGYGPGAWAYWPLFLASLAFMVIGVWRLRRHWLYASTLVLLIWLPIAINVFFWRMRALSLYEQRIFIFCGVVAIIAVANGIGAIPRPSWRWPALIVFVLLMIPGLVNHYQHRLHPVVSHRIGMFDKVDFRSAADAIREKWAKGDVVAHDSIFTVPSMQHYLPVPQFHVGPPEDAALYVRAVANEALFESLGLLPVPVEEVTKEAQRVWLVEAFGVTFDDAPQSIPAREALARNFTLVDQVKLEGVRILRFDRRPEIGAGQSIR